MAAGRDRGTGFCQAADRSRQRADEREAAIRASAPSDPVARLRERADNMAATAAAMKKIADAADPLYKTLDDGQKRRLAVLTHMEHRFGGLAAPPVRARHGHGPRPRAAIAALAATAMTGTAAERGGPERL